MNAPRGGPDGRLDSWKEIAGYLKRGVRTVQRWEQNHGLPVHRLDHERLGSVFAYTAELDGWWESRCRQLDAKPESDPVERPIAAPPAIEPVTGKRALPWVSVLALLTAILFLLAVRTRSGGGLPAAPLNPVPLTSDLGSERWPSFSPDGNQVAYGWDGPAQNNFDIYVKVVGSENPLRLTHAPEPDVFPAWSPDGRQIAFIRAFPKGRSQLMLIPAIGGAERVVTDTNLDAGPIAWSPDGRWIVGSQQSPRGPLVAISPETGECRRLTLPSGELSYDLNPAVAPDGLSLIFARHVGATGDLFRLRLTRQFAPDGEPERLTKTDSWANTAAFTNDGKAVVYASGAKGGSPSLWLLPLSPSPGTPRALLKMGDQLFSPAISRQHHRLAFSVEKEIACGTWTLALTADFRPSGEAVPVVTSTHVDLNAQYSPDGRRIVFHSTRSGDSEIWVSDADGSHMMRLTSLQAPITGAPRWSPDGKRIVFDSNLEGSFEVYLIPSSGGQPVKLTNTAGINGVASWSHDGRWIYFVSDRSGSTQIWKMTPNGGNLQQITKHGGYLAFESWDGRWLYYCKTQGASPLMRVPVDGGEETQVLPEVDEFNFCVTSRGILFASSDRAIDFYDFKTGRTKPFVKVKSDLWTGMAISRDERHLLFSQVQGGWSTKGSDLMLVENFNP